jgi:hypothetical protein
MIYDFFSKIREDLCYSKGRIGVNDTVSELATGVFVPVKFTAAVTDSGGHIFLAIYSDRSVTGNEYVTGVNNAGDQLATSVYDSGGNFAACVIERSMKKP